jgi:hypothetical protein
MGLEDDKLAVVGIAALLAAFFVAGFISSSFLGAGQGTPTGQATDMADGEDSQSDGPAVSQDEAISRAERFLMNTQFDYPFVRNVSTITVEKDTSIGGDGFMYNWTVSFIVEPNPFQGELYSVPQNQTQATKTMTVFVSPNGDYIFPPPTSTTISRRPAPPVPQ